jgi:DNA polymerase III alpha subunit
MNQDIFGRQYFTEQEIFVELYRNPALELTKFKLHWDKNPVQESYNKSVKELNLDWGFLDKLEILPDLSAEEFHKRNQNKWHIPDVYKNLDVPKLVLDLCSTQEEKQRVAEELLLYQERNLIDLLRYMKYLVDTLTANNIVWGVGRGSSVASFVLYLLGVHKINSLYYGLEISEFLK